MLHRKYIRMKQSIEEKTYEHMQELKTKSSQQFCTSHHNSEREPFLLIIADLVLHVTKLAVGVIAFGALFIILSTDVYRFNFVLSLIKFTSIVWQLKDHWTSLLPRQVHRGSEKRILKWYLRCQPDHCLAKTS